ncbi:Hypothetical protein FKW44_012592, partial [Caligus rogercresseyi]
SKKRAFFGQHATTQSLELEAFRTETFTIHDFKKDVDCGLRTGMFYFPLLRAARLHISLLHGILNS